MGSHSRPVKFRRTGRHARPSAAGEAARAAAIAAPALALAGTLTTAAGHPAAAAVHFAARPRAVAVLDAYSGPLHAARPADVSSWTVRPGDTLYSIAVAVYGDGYDWPAIWHANRDVISSPGLIYVGQRLAIPGSPGVSLTSAPGPSVPYGTLGCAGLEDLWDDAGGAPGEAFTAAEVAIAESGGYQYAYDPDGGGTGYWQIDSASWGDLATFDAYGNARSAIIISHDGSDWYPWVTYVDGAYAGRC
jgi:LysM repeat protein